MGICLDKILRLCYGSEDVSDDVVAVVSNERYGRDKIRVIVLKQNRIPFNPKYHFRPIRSSTRV